MAGSFSITDYIDDPVQAKPAQPSAAKPAQPAQVSTDDAYAVREVRDGHHRDELSWPSVSGPGRSAESEDADAEAIRDLWTYGMKLNMDRAFDIDKENRAQARKIKSAGWQTTGSHVDYNYVRTSGSSTASSVDYTAMLRPFDAPSGTTMPSGAFIGIQNWDGAFHNEDYGKYLESTSKAMLGMESLQKYTLVDENGVKSFPADGFEEAWNSLTAKQKDEITGSYRDRNITHASASEGNPYKVTTYADGSVSLPSGHILAEGQRFDDGRPGALGRRGTIMITTRDADGKVTGSRFYDENTRTGTSLGAVATEKALNSEKARDGHLADAVDDVRTELKAAGRLTVRPGRGDRINGRSGTIMMTTRDVDGKATGGVFHDESRPDEDVWTGPATTEKILGSDGAASGHLADTMDRLRDQLEKQRANEAAEAAADALRKDQADQ